MAPSSSNAGHFFQTTDSIEQEKRRAAKAKNKNGDPIPLPSKLLSVVADPKDSSAVYVSESAGEVKRVSLESGQTKRLYPLTGAPLTSLALSTTSDEIYAGSWDKHIHTLSPISKPSSSSERLLKGHTDFVKCLVTTTLDKTPILISGGADAAIIVWNLQTGTQLHKIRADSAVQDIAIDPTSLHSEGENGNTAAVGSSEIEIFVSFSTPEIRRYSITLAKATETQESKDNPISVHDTSIYRLHFDSEGDVWTASADNTARRLVRYDGWKDDTVLQHPDFVRDVVIAESLGLVVTACRDEEVRVWDVASGNLLCVYTGHFEEVTGLALIDGGRTVVSVGIDATVRKWSLERKEMVEFEERRKEGEDIGVPEEDKEESKQGLLTAEEEAELAELMNDDD